MPMTRTPTSLSSDLTSALARARSKRDVAQLLRHHDHSDVAAAWSQLAPIDQAALLLVRGFDGSIIDEDPDA